MCIVQGSCTLTFFHPLPHLFALEFFMPLPALFDGLVHQLLLLHLFLFCLPLLATAFWVRDRGVCVFILGILRIGTGYHESRHHE